MRILITIAVYSCILLFLFHSEEAFSRINHFPARSCKSAWQDFHPQNFLFNFERDSRITSRGNEGYSEYVERISKLDIRRKDCHKTWTVLIYMSADNDLTPYALTDLVSMEAFRGIVPGQGASSIKTDVIVELEARNSPEIRRLHIFESPAWGSSSLKQKDHLNLQVDQIRSPIISAFQKSPHENKAKRLSQFLKWAIHEYPSEYYLVMIWGHGQGWTALSSEEVTSPDLLKKHSKRFGGLAVGGTEESPDYLDIPTLHRILMDASHLRGDRIDIFATDACLMQTIENTVELDSCTRFITGSEDMESYAGFPYPALLKELNSELDENSDEPRKIAWLMPKLFQESYDPETGSQRELDSKAFEELTCSTIETKHLRSSLIPAMNELGLALINFIEERDDRWMDLKNLIQQGPFYPGGTQDLGDFLKRLDDLVMRESHENHLNPSPGTQLLEEAILDTYVSLNYTVINSALGKKYEKFNSSEELGARGLSVWLPKDDEEFQSRFDDFSKSLFYHSDSNGKTPGWKAWMMMMYPKCCFLMS